MTLLIVEILSGLDISEESWVYAETQIIPSISVSERYDTNVFFAPRSFVPAGTKLWDFVTTAAPQVEVLNKNQQAETSIRAGVSGNAFINNPDLAFVSTNLDATSRLDGLIGQLIPGAKLRVSESFRYTPEPPAFLTGGKPGATADSFTRGLQGFRANTFANIASAQGAYSLSQTVTLRGDYSYSLFRAGTFFVQSTGGGPTFFDTNIQRWSVGPSVRLTSADTVTLKYQDTQMNQAGTTTNLNFTTRAVLGEYVFRTSDLTATMTGGGTFLEQGDHLFASGGLVLEWNYDRSTRLRLTGSRDIVPGFFGLAGALITNTVSLTAERQLSKVLSLTTTGNYAYGQIEPAKTQTYESYAGSVQMRYFITRTLSASLSYTYSSFSYNSPPSAPFVVPRQFFMFSLEARWP